MSEFTKEVIVTPAFDKRAPEPSKNYGIGSCRIMFVLKGPKGAVQFVIGTNWYVPSAREHLEGFSLSRRDMQRKPDGWDVGYHSHVPMYDGHSLLSKECSILGGPCYYDGSGLMANEWVEDFVAGGTDWLWPKLEQSYREFFETVEAAA